MALETTAIKAPTSRTLGALPRDKWRFTFDEIRAYGMNEKFMIMYFSVLRPLKKDDDGKRRYDRESVKVFLELWRKYKTEKGL